MYGGQWIQASAGLWKLVWSEESIRDFYLNNILIHELGHLVDSRNSRYVDRERYAEWFALEYGYKASRRRPRASGRSRGHHAANGWPDGLRPRPWPMRCRPARVPGVFRRALRPPLGSQGLLPARPIAYGE